MTLQQKTDGTWLVVDAKKRVVAHVFDKESAQKWIETDAEQFVKEQAQEK